MKLYLDSHTVFYSPIEPAMSLFPLCVRIFLWSRNQIVGEKSHERTRNELGPRGEKTASRITISSLFVKTSLYKLQNEDPPLLVHTLTFVRSNRDKSLPRWDRTTAQLGVSRSTDLLLLARISRRPIGVETARRAQLYAPRVHRALGLTPVKGGL